MAYFTRVSFDEMADICCQFNCGNLLTIDAIDAGTINSNFALSTDKGKWFGRVNEGKSRAEVEWEAKLLTHLAANGCPVVVPLSTVAGASALSLSSAPHKWVCVFPWRAGHHLAADQVSVVHGSAVGATLAHLHLTTQPLLAELGRPDRYHLSNIIQRYQVCVAADDPLLRDVLPALGDQLALITNHQALRDAATSTIIHGDLFRDNVLFVDGVLSTLLDFEQASTGSASYDLAVAIHDWCWTPHHHQPNWDLVAGLLTGYQTLRLLTPSDMVSLPWDLRMAAVRFTITRITDVYLAGQHSPAKDFRAFLARVIFWSDESSMARLSELAYASKQHPEVR